MGHVCLPSTVVHHALLSARVPFSYLAPAGAPATWHASVIISGAGYRDFVTVNTVRHCHKLSAFIHAYETCQIFVAGLICNMQGGDGRHFAIVAACSWCASGIM